MTSQYHKSNTVLLVEPSFHFEVVRSIGCIFFELGYKVDVLTNSYCLPYLKSWAEDKLIDLITDKDREKIDYRYYQIIVVTSPDHKRTNISHKNKFLLIHNLNYWLYTYANLAFLRTGRIKSIMRALKYSNPIVHYRNQKYLKSFKGLLVPSQIMYNDTKHPMVKGFLDISFHDKTLTVGKNENIKRIVVSGSGFKDRNINMVIHILNQIVERLNENVELVILGSFSANIVMPKEINNQISIITFPDIIPQNQYDKYLMNSHLAIIPINKYKEYKGVNEKRGYTNLTGSVNDVIRKGIPALIPEYYPVPDLLQDLFYTYKSEEDLYRLIEKFFHTLPDKNLIHSTLQLYFNEVLESQKQVLNKLFN